MSSGRQLLIAVLLASACGWAGCARDDAGSPSRTTAADPALSMNRIAESYVRLVLAVGEHDPDYVDA